MPPPPGLFLFVLFEGHSDGWNCFKERMASEEAEKQALVCVSIYRLLHREGASKEAGERAARTLIM